MIGSPFTSPASDDVGKPLDQLVRHAWGGIALFFLLLFLSATFFRVSGAIIAPGQLTTVETAHISHPAGGALEALLVKEGQSVSRGDILLRLDTTALSSQTKTATSNRIELLARQTRLRAELFGDARMTSPAELTESDQAEAGEMMRREAQLFASRRADRQHSVRLIREQASQQQATIGKYSAQIDATERQLKLIEDELVGLQKLYSKGLVTKNRVNSSERAAIQLEATRASLQANIFEARARVAAAQQQAADIERNLRDRIESELTDVTRDLAEQTNRLRSSKNDATRGVITAPISGTVEQLAYRTRGSAIPSGAPIMTIVPTNQIRQIEAPITPGDIDLIHIGQNVRMILSTSGETARTELRGTVSYVASASVLDERTGAHSYTVRIKPDAHAASQIKALRYGTPVEAYFVTKDRSMLSYLLRPLTEQLERAFKR